jgi:polysaccharide export outer membrane protein
MRFQRFFFLGLIAFFLSVFSAQAMNPNGSLVQADKTTSQELVDPNNYSSYKLGAGDVITIRVFGEDDLSKERIKLTDAGTVPYPVLGELKVLGLTIGDLERLIVDGLKGRYLKNPKVSVQVDEYRPFYIYGMVDKPGFYPYQHGLTVRKAVSIAGGFKERASLSKIWVFREGDKKNSKEAVKLDTVIGPGDTIQIEESFF